MNAFIMTFQRGEQNVECYVQHLKSREEDIFIVNFKDSELIRQFQGTKTVLHMGRQKSSPAVMSNRSHLKDCIQRLFR
jgi:hypothetical protein